MKNTFRNGYEHDSIIIGNWQRSVGHDLSGEQTTFESDTKEFVGSGLCTFDMADIYVGVEEMFGEFRSRHPEIADRMRIHTKYVPDYDDLSSLDKLKVKSDIDAIRERLNTDVVDLVQFHHWDYGVGSFLSTFEILVELAEQGLIHNVGVTNFGVEQLQEMIQRVGAPMSIQLQYSLLDQRPKAEMIPLTVRNGVAVLCYGTLAGGFLTDRYVGVLKPEVDELNNRSLIKYMSIIDRVGGWDYLQEILKVLSDIAKEKGCTISQLASKFILDCEGVSGVIIGAKNTRRLPEIYGIETIELTDLDRARIQRVLDQKVMLPGDVYELERTDLEMVGKNKKNLNRTR